MPSLTLYILIFADFFIFDVSIFSFSLELLVIFFMRFGSRFATFNQKAVLKN